MTKTVRIENADSGTSFRVVVEIWDKTANGDVLVKNVNLDYPTAMMTNEYITSTRYMVVREAPAT